MQLCLLFLGRLFGYFVNDGVLMRKWTSPKMPCQDNWSIVFQVVVPSAYCLTSHYHFLAGHMGVRKTWEEPCVEAFFWPGVRNDIAQYCRTCHVCQTVGKPNQKIPPAPLHPIPAVGEPFERILIDCVGPLPRTKSGNQYYYVYGYSVPVSSLCLKEKWLTNQSPPTNLLDFVCNFRSELTKACDIAK